MTSELNLLLAMSFVGFLAFAAFAAMRSGQRRQLLFCSSVRSYSDHSSSALRISNSSAGCRSKRWRRAAASCDGCALPLHGRGHACPIPLHPLPAPQEQPEEMGLGNFLAPVLASPIVFYPLQGALQSAGLTSRLSPNPVSCSYS